MFEKSANSKSYRIMISALGGLLFLTLVIALTPSFREKAQNLFWAKERQILAKSQGFIEVGGTFLTVIKVKTKNGLFVELYKSKDENAPIELWTEFPLEGNQDGYFNFQYQSTNLVLTDVDNDGYLDIMAPTFDENQQARMNVFRYDVEAEMYTRLEKN